MPKTKQKPEQERITTAVEGFKFKVTTYRGGNEVEEELTVGPKCDKSGGQWLCATHDKNFANNMQKDFHIGRGKHVLVWFCFTHGAEVP